jgi:hypothetical protein
MEKIDFVTFEFSEPMTEQEMLKKVYEELKDYLGEI